MKRILLVSAALMLMISLMGSVASAAVGNPIRPEITIQRVRQ